MIKKLFSHTILYGIAPQISKIAGIFTLPIITQYLTEVDFGVYGVITAVVGGISVFAHLGLGIILNNSFVKTPLHFKWVWRQIYGFLIIWNLPYALMLGGIIYLFVPDEAVKNVFWIILLNVLPIVFFGPTSTLGNAYYQLRQNPLPIVVRTSLLGFLTVALNLYFIAGLKMGYMGWFLSTAIGQMILQLSYWIPINITHRITPIFNFKWRYLKKYLSITVPTIPHYYGAYLLNTSDRVVMKMVNVNTESIGMYNAANLIGNLFQTLSTASGQAVAPFLLKLYKDRNEFQARKLIFSLQIIFLFLTFCASIWMKEVFSLLIKNKALSQVYPIAIIIVMAYNYRPMYLGANNRLFYYEKTKVLLKVTFVAGILNLLLNFLFIPFWGYKVAAYTTFICLMYMGYIGYYLKEFRDSNNVNYHPMKWLTVTVLLTILAYFIVEMSLVIKVLTMILFISIGVLIYIKLINEVENE